MNFLAIHAPCEDGFLQATFDNFDWQATKIPNVLWDPEAAGKSVAARLAKTQAPKKSKAMKGKAMKKNRRKP